ncbi:MAG TPA: transglycosylase domain-containing protein, partial [Chitinophagaceae bacterium]|nr:transglycosylase domain-containing protein [Chitinophagaceae bacterium]
MKRSVKILWRVVIFGMLGFFLLILLINWGVFGYMPSIDDLQNPSASLSSEVYASDGSLMGKYYLQDRTNCDFSEISPNVIHALIATEDERFYSHSGIDPKGTVAIPLYLLIGKKRGSSTITQQLAFNLFNGERAKNPFVRTIQKLKEWILAVKLERYFTKNEILALYLNTVPFSDNVYGINNAAKTFFSKSPDRLDIPESATLIGMLKGNTLYNPRRNPRAALERRNTVLDRMRDAGFLSPGQTAIAKSSPIQLQYIKLDQNDGTAPYFREYLRDVMKQWCAAHKKDNGDPYNLYTDGLKIYTTIIPSMQQDAEEAVAEQLARLQPIFSAQPYIKNGRCWVGHQNVLIAAMRNTDRYKAMKDDGMSDDDILHYFNTKKVHVKVFAWGRYSGSVKNTMDTLMTPMDSIRYMLERLQTGFMVMDPESGEVKAWVGGDDFLYFKNDHIHNTKRQVGSTIKPLLYARSIMDGFAPSTMVPNDPVYFPDFHNWHSHNAEGNTGGMVTLTDALAQSLNNVSAYLIKMIGPATLVDFAHRAGITSDIPPYPSISLGTPEISLYEMMRAYSMFPDKGLVTEPVYITKIEDRNGNILESFAPLKKEVISESLAYTMVGMMEQVVNAGTGARIRGTYHMYSEMAGKTGTTNDQTDGWFIGFTPQLLAGAWVGCDNNFLHFTSLANGQGANTGLPIWALFFQKVFQDKTLGIDPNAHFDIPESIMGSLNATDSTTLADSLQTVDLGNGSAADYSDPGTP